MHRNDKWNGLVLIAIIFLVYTTKHEETPLKYLAYCCPFTKSKKVNNNNN